MFKEQSSHINIKLFNNSTWLNIHEICIKFYMDNIIILPLIKYLQNIPVEINSILLLSTCIIATLSLFKLFGKQGLHIYCIVAIIAANIQVLKVVQFDFYPYPVALGTIVFASTYLSSAILSEHFGELAAQQNIWYCFCAQILMTLFMLITIGHKPLFSNDSIIPLSISLSPKTIENIKQTEQAIATLFTPLPRFLFASLISFIISQKVGIFIFNLIKKLTLNQYLWLRTLTLFISSALIDTFMFNLLAWKLLSPHPLDFTMILHTYIICTLITQWFVIILSIPMVYLSYFLK